MQKTISILGAFTLLFVATLSLSSCAGRTPRLVMVRQYGDSQRSCGSLKTEMQNARNEINQLITEEHLSGILNTISILEGLFFFWPALFFINSENAAAIEYEAYRQRYDYLSNISSEKQCSIKKENPLSVEGMKKESKHLEQKQKNKK